MSTSDGSNSSMGECDAPGSRVADARGQCRGPQTGTIEGLPNDVLLEVFRFYLHDEEENHACQSWRTLVHVCQSWRFMVFSSPRHLNLRLRCTDRTRAREMLDVWPAFLPIVIQNADNARIFTEEECADNIVAALEHNSRVHEFSYWGYLVPRFAAAMRRPFPELKDLLLRIDDVNAPTLPNSFLGGSAPRLRALWLDNVRVPGLQRILLSASDLVCLRLIDFPNSGFIPPDAMVACLSTMSRLEEFDLEFDPRQYRTDREPASRSPPPLKRTVLPALTSLTFNGTREYVEDFVARIDAPLLVYIKVVISHGLFLRTPQLLPFIDRIEKFPLLYQADVIFFDKFVDFQAHPRKRTDHDVSPVLEVSCYNDSNTQLSSLAQFCTSSSPLFSTIELLKISRDRHWEPFDDYQLRWLELLHPFLAVKDLYLSEELALLVMPFLHLHTGVLPALQSLFVVGLQPSGAVQEVVGEFVAARLVSGHVVTVHRWERRRGNAFGA